MTAYTIYHKRTRTTLFETTAHSAREALEKGVQDGIDFSGADLTHKDLSNANLDDGLFAHADFSYSNLSGANLSEAQLGHARFHHTSLYNCCLSYSYLADTDFSDADFGATDIHGATLDRAKFNSLSCFSLPFIQSASMRDCVFSNMHGASLRFSEPPIVILGRAIAPTVMVGGHMMEGHKLLHWKPKDNPAAPYIRPLST